MARFVSHAWMVAAGWCVLTLAPRADAHAERAVLFKVEAPDLNERHQRMLRLSLLAEIHKYEGVVASDVAALTPRHTTDMPCYTEEPVCLNRLADLWDADTALVLRVASNRDEHVLVLKRIAIRSGEVLHAATQRARGDSAAHLVGLGNAVADILPEFGLRHNQHIGISEAVLMRWEPQPIPQWTTWTSGIATLLAGAATAIFYIRARQAQADYNAYVSTAAEQPLEGAHLVSLGHRVTQMSRRGNISLGIAGGLLITTGILALFTDWGSDAVWENVYQP